MNFSFEYNIAGKVTTVVVTLEDEVVTEAQNLGIDITSLEIAAKDAMDGFVNKVTTSSFWQRATHAVDAIKSDIKKVVSKVENLVEPAPATPPPASDPTTPAA